MYRVKAKKIGYQGEKLAAQYLQSKGYEILEKNFTIRGGEIDIIARQGDMLIFVEVKTRSRETFGPGEESMNNLKKYRLDRTIMKYLEKNNQEDSDFRLDLIQIELDPTTQALEYIEHFEDIES